MPIPPPSFSPWFSWSLLDRGTPSHLAAQLREVGCYLLARFDGSPPDGEANPADPNVFYIGETHGNTTSLWGRLMCFGNSAGFYGGQWNGHYAAWGYPKTFPQDDRGPGAEEAGRHTDPSRVFVALCAWPGTLSRPLRGVYPVVIEQQAIWMHAADPRNNAIPRLNNSGRVTSALALSPPEFSDYALTSALRVDVSQTERTTHLTALVDGIAAALGANKNCKPWPATYGRWQGVERKLYRNVHLYLGWSSVQPESITLSVYQGAKGSSWACMWGEKKGGAADREALRALLLELWSWWHVS